MLLSDRKNEASKRFNKKKKFENREFKHVRFLSGVHG